MGESVITTYSGCTISTDLSTITPTGNPITQETIQTSSFDQYGNALAQTVYTQYYDTTPGANQNTFQFSSYQAISNNTYDLHNRLLSSTVDNYSDQGKTFTSRELITDSNYDVYGNAVNQVVNTYNSTTATTANLVNSQVIVNQYGNVTAAFFHHATTSTVSKYNTDVTASQSLSTMIDQTVTNTTSFDTLGNALTQTTDKFVASLGSLVQTTHMDITNSGYDGRGDASSQSIATYNIDGAVKTLVSYQVFTDRTYDSNHEVTNQMVLTYADLAGTTLLDCQEIRSSGFTASGVATNQVIVTYLDQTEKSIIDVKTITNSDISSTGNVGESVITTYASAKDTC